MEKRRKDDLVFLVPEPPQRSPQHKAHFLWFLLFIGFALCFLSFAGYYFTKTNFRLVRFVIDEKRHSKDPTCSGISNLDRFDCHPDVGSSAESCQKRGCCYQTTGNGVLTKSKDSDFPPLNVPWCFYPSDYNGYVLGKVLQDGKQMRATLKRNTPSGFPNDIQNLNLVITFIDDYSLRVKITDSSAARFEVPIPINDTPKPLEEPCYDVSLDSKGKLVIARKSSKKVIFSTNLSQLVYADQFLQLSTDLPSPYIYGLGEHYGSFLRNINWTRITIFNSDRGPTPNYPIYGAQPFYLSLEEDGNANGVFLLNSNAMDVILQPKPAVTFRPIGGVLDFFIMLGPSAANVVQQYTSIVGTTFMPPYWSLGFQLCRYGYNSLNKTRETMQRTIDAGIPLQVQWNDIDYMDHYKDFTYDQKNFDGLPEFVEDLHKRGMHYVLMTDPGLSASEKPGTYPPYDEGVKQDVFIKNSNGSIFHGKVWTDGETVFPDFSHPNAEAFWTKQFTDFYDKIKFDGVWIDMNEPSNFYDGRKDGCDVSSYEDPYYLPNGNLPLRHKTVCMTAKHHSTIHYNEHNLFSYREATATNKALRAVRGKRPFIISRATFSGQGSQSGHWSGDIVSSWEDMRYSVSSILNFNIYGISMIGSDICGFGYNTTVPLCARWQALGAFYPFSRNHNDRGAVEQDPAILGPVVVEATKNSLYIRYLLLPYLYTLFYRSHVYGDTVVRPVFFEFPGDKNTYPIDEQFLWGPAMMILPVLYPNATSVTAYFPKGTWYDKEGKLIKSKGEKITLASGETDIQVALRSGFIIPGQLPDQKTTTESRKNPFVLFVLLDEEQQATGELYWDDGDSLETYKNGEYNFIEFKLSNNTLQNNVVKSAYADTMSLSVVDIIGIKKPNKVSVNGVECKMLNSNEEKKMGFGFVPNVRVSKQPEGNTVTCVADAHGDNGLNIGMENISLLSPLTILWN